MKKSQLLHALSLTGGVRLLPSDYPSWMLPTQITATIIFLFSQGPIDEKDLSVIILYEAMNQLKTYPNVLVFEEE